MASDHSVLGLSLPVQTGDPGLRDELIRLYMQRPRLRYVDIANRIGLRVDEIAPLLLALIREGVVPARKGSGGMTMTQGQLERLYYILNCRKRGETWLIIAKSLGISRQAAQQFYRFHSKQLSRSPCIDEEAC